MSQALCIFLILKKENQFLSKGSKGTKKELCLVIFWLSNKGLAKFF